MTDFVITPRRGPMFITRQGLPMIASDAFYRASDDARCDFWIEIGLPDSWELRWDFLAMYCGL